MAKRKSKTKGTREPRSLRSSVRSRSVRTNLPTLTSSPLAYLSDPVTRPGPLFTAGVSRTGGTATKTKPKAKQESVFNAQIAFKAPAATLVCVRRNTRKQVLHALNQTGKAGQRAPKRTQWSNIKC